MPNRVFKEMREAIIDIVSGSVAGMVSTAVGHPFDTLKEIDSTWKDKMFENFWAGKLSNLKKTRMQIYPGRYKNSISYGFYIFTSGQTVDILHPHVTTSVLGCLGTKFFFV